MSSVVELSRMRSSGYLWREKGMKTHYMSLLKLNQAEDHIAQEVLLYVTVKKVMGVLLNIVEETLTWLKKRFAVLQCWQAPSSCSMGISSFSRWCKSKGLIGKCARDHVTVYECACMHACMCVCAHVCWGGVRWEGGRVLGLCGCHN